jgi:hypothetical protein
MFKHKAIIFISVFVVAMSFLSVQLSTEQSDDWRTIEFPRPTSPSRLTANG